MNIVGRIIHISDLHIGLIDPATGNAMIPTTGFGRLRMFDGLWGHRARALKYLSNFLNDERAQAAREGYPIRLVVTGDMTSYSHSHQWNTAEQFLGNVLSLPSGFQWGLQDPDWANQSVSGNHDQWGGRAFPLGAHAAGSVPATLGNFHKALAAVDDPPFVLKDGTAVRFIRIDTDRDVAAHSGERLRAWGSFVSQLDAIDADASATALLERDGEIRVLLLHHSRSHNSWRLRMDDVSKKRLDRFTFDHRVRVMLCGHCHSTAIVPHSVHHSMGVFGSHSVLEARCGTTTRRDDWPANLQVFRQMLGRSLTPNSLLTHTIVSGSRGLIWQIQEYGPNAMRPGQMFVSRGRTLSAAPVTHSWTR